ncbi:MAG TPA: WD40 repeat domain-containing protein [Candidatus Babeliales bacterium]|nr:WD40 repeat domain-containing protein [Candidatus Babeliales bacterium]
MIKRFCIFFLLPAVIISSSRAMHHPIHLHPPSADKQLYSVACSHDKIFIGGSDGVHVYNTITGTKHALSQKPTFHMAMHPNYLNIAISHETELAVYDTKTEEKKWSTQPLYLWKTTPIIFSSTDNTICSYRRGAFTLHSDHKIFLKQFNVPYEKKTAYCLQIACHPTKKKFLYPSDKDSISIIKPNRFREIKKTIVSPKSSYIFSALYNYDGSTIGMIDTFGNCCLYNDDDKTITLIEYSSPSLSSNYYISIAFHPHKHILALLADNNSIHYWLYKTKKLIAVTKSYQIFNNNQIEQTYFSRVKRLDFSPDGSCIAVVFPYECYQLSVPRNKNMVLLYYILRRQALPTDIINIIIKLIPALLEFQYFDFFESLRI